MDHHPPDIGTFYGNVSDIICVTSKAHCRKSFSVDFMYFVLSWLCGWVESVSAAGGPWSLGYVFKFNQGHISDKFMLK